MVHILQTYAHSGPFNCDGIAFLKLDFFAQGNRTDTSNEEKE
jgi:hypothetical protein